MADEAQNEEVEDQQPDTDAPNDAEVDSQEDDAVEHPDWMKDFSPNKAYRRIREQARSIEQLKKAAQDAEQNAKRNANSVVDDLTKERDSIAQENLRLSVGYELGLPLALAKRLSGGTREELIADAEELVKIAGGGPVRPRKPVEALRAGGEGDREPEETDLQKIGARMFRR